MSTGSSEIWIERATGERVPIQGNLAIGRSSTNDVVVAGEKASRRHATIHAQDKGEFWLIDLGSANGTFLNQRRVFQPVSLRDGDTIEIAGESFVFHLGAITAEQAQWDDQDAVTMREIRSERCWLLVADVAQFTELSQRLDAEKLGMVMGGWVRQSRELIERNGGVVNKYLGDGYLAFWRASPETPAQILAVLEANRKMQSQPEPTFRVVIHVGKVLFGGNASMSEDCLMGPDVNFAFRLEKLAGGLGVEILLSAEAQEELKGSARCDLIPGEHELKGFSGSHVAYNYAGLLPISG